jgi:hypothetical protein
VCPVQREGARHVRSSADGLCVRAMQGNGYRAQRVYLLCERTLRVRRPTGLVSGMSNDEARSLRVEANELQRRAQQLQEKADRVERAQQHTSQTSRLEDRIYRRVALPARTPEGFHPDEYNGTTHSREALDARDANNPPKLVLERASATRLAGAIQLLRRMWSQNTSTVSVLEIRGILEEFDKVQL